MRENIFSEIDGKEIIICNLSIEHYEKTHIVKMSCIAEDRNAYFIVFKNVSKLNLSEISYPFQVCGFEILDCTSRGYQGDSGYCVNDREDGKISFYCEDFEIFNANR